MHIYLNKYGNVTVCFRNQYAVLIGDCKHSCVYVCAIDLAVELLPGGKYRLSPKWNPSFTLQFVKCMLQQIGVFEDVYSEAVLTAELDRKVNTCDELKATRQGNIRDSFGVMLVFVQTELE
jgi:hypothetical protein